MTNLRELREKHCLTQQMLANRLDVAKATIGAYERGINFPGREMLIKLADYFKVSIDELIGREI
ncbi:helix-turn-helix domain-containing protein [Liquorilactobacillus uvarum]|uniref:helix-turn-helix domain-containing protein n=1 Tax=Liquorilactobacillus uvarum TaxID=303240 RepID=UPI00070FC09F|nr:helix-turn-helix transcriptional regulator [Liquorilactobacillus uvarum]